MKREEVKELLPIMTAFIEGKSLEVFTNEGKWEDYNCPDFYPNLKYRIKNDTKYRPFSSMAECWEEMDKHEPFGWLKDKTHGDLIVITTLENDFIVIGSHNCLDYAVSMREFSFADGEPFGVERL